MRTSQGFIVIAIALLLQSCFDSSDYIFDEAEATDITIDASLAHSMSTVSPSVKADTFSINDTIYFLTNITPNKIIRVQDYHWLMDGVYCSSEYNFKKQVTEPGHHQFKFVLKDYFGDMHYDSLEVWIAGHPVLNDSAYTPAEGTQAFDPYESIYFTWSASTEGISLSHYYHFTLSEESYTNSKSDFASIDTILTEPHFIFHNKLNPFKEYNWTVQAYNEYGFESEEIIESNFFTKGAAKEGALQATINTSQDLLTPVQVTLQNLSDTSKTYRNSYTLVKSDNKISLGSVLAGTYRLKITSSNTDFDEIKKDVVINEGFVTIINNIMMVDSIKPVITSTSGLDTLQFADTLQFIIKDGGGALRSSDIAVSLEDEQITNKVFKDSVLTVILNKNDQSWTYRILNISATDGSNNTRTKSFYIAPSTLWFITNNDTTITSDKSLLFVINDKNPFGFKVDSLKFFNVTQDKLIASAQSKDASIYTVVLKADSFEEFQTIRSTVLYKNGISQSKDWTLTVIKSSTEEDE